MKSLKSYERVAILYSIFAMIGLFGNVAHADGDDYVDTDQDGVSDDNDNCPNIPNPIEVGFTDSGQRLGNSSSSSVALGDLNEDGLLDAFVANHHEQGDRVWFGSGDGIFIDSGQSLGNFQSVKVKLGDLVLHRCEKAG